MDPMEESEDDDSSEDLFPLHDPAHLENPCSLFRLINHGHNINMYNSKGETPIHIAATNGYEEALMMLLDNGGDPNLCDDNEESALLKIVKSEYIYEKCVQILLDQNVDPDLGDATNWTALHEACYRGEITLIEKLITARAFLNVQTEDGITPLYTSSQYGQFDCVRLLLDCGASPNINTNEQDSPLYIACQQGHTDCARLLINSGCAVNHCNDSGMSPLAAACTEDNYECAKLLIDNHAEPIPSPAADSDTSPLHIAARQQGGTCLNLLLLHDLDINKTGYDTTPLFEAAINDNSYGCQLLLAEGADPNRYCAGDGMLHYTPLMVAARDDLLNVVIQLISGGADVNYGTFTSPLILAAKSKSFDSLNYLLDNADVDVNHVDPGRNTALSSVCGIICLGHVSMTYYQELLDCFLNLLKFGADISRLFQVDVYSHVMDLPLIHSHPKLMKLMLEFDGEREETREICQLKYSHRDWKPLCDIVNLPRKLEHLCRLVIRRSLGYKRLKLIDELPLPDPLKNYLKHTTTTD